MCPEPQSYVALAKEVCEYIVHAFGQGNLTTDGLQNSTAAVSTAAGTFTEVERVNVQPTTEITGHMYPAPILEVEFNLAGYILKTNTAPEGAAIYKWQARELGLSDTCWVNLCTAWSTVCATSDDTWIAVSRSGYFKMATNLAKVPLQVRMVITGGGNATPANNTCIQGKMSSQSYIRVLYKAF